MRALSSLLGASFVLALVTAWAPALAAGEIAETAPIVRVEFDLPVGKGLHAHLETSQKKEVTLTVGRKVRGAVEEVVYEVHGRVNETGLKVRFGRLGLVDVAFTPTTTLDETAPSPGCTGAPRTLEEGVFTGTISFAGERGYVGLEAQQVEGSMSVIAPWQCPKEDDLSPFEDVPGFARLSARPGHRQHESASLVAFSAGFKGFFGAGVHHRHSGGRSIFYGAREERGKKMTVIRVTSVQGPASAFDFDLKKGTATLDPPPPLKGHASFRGDEDGGFWHSTIRVPLLGSPPLRTGHGFGALLYPEYQFD
jgi:hypothetical protein